MLNMKTCNHNYGKVTGIVYIPAPEAYMCKSIRKYYAKIQLIAQGYSKESAELISKTMVG